MGILTILFYISVIRRWVDFFKKKKTKTGSSFLVTKNTKRAVSQMEIKN